MRHNAGFAAAALLGVLAVLGGCTTPSLQDAAPVSAADRAEEGGPPALAGTGDYPNLNIVPTPAAEQFTQEEASERADELRALRDRQAGSRAVTDRSAELRRLGSSHAGDALRAIEGR